MRDSNVSDKIQGSASIFTLEISSLHGIMTEIHFDSCTPFCYRTYTDTIGLGYFVLEITSTKW